LFSHHTRPSRLLAALAFVLALAAGVRFAKDGTLGAQALTWLLVAVIFTAVSVWLLIGS
jgi:hypothetical protein